MEFRRNAYIFPRGTVPSSYGTNHFFVSVLSVQGWIRAVYVWQGEKVSNPLPLVLETNPDPVEFKAPALYCAGAYHFTASGGGHTLR